MHMLNGGTLQAQQQHTELNSMDDNKNAKHKRITNQEELRRNNNKKERKKKKLSRTKIKTMKRVSNKC